MKLWSKVCLPNNWSMVSTSETGRSLSIPATMRSTGRRVLSHVIAGFMIGPNHKRTDGLDAGIEREVHKGSGFSPITERVSPTTPTTSAT